MKNPVREKMLAGDKTIGTFMAIGSGTAAECIGLAGYDYVIIDTEHGPFNPDSAIDYIRAAKLYGAVPFVRVQDTSRASILKMLDGGAMGLIIPQINTVEEVRSVVQHGKYTPVGNRGVAPGVGTGFWAEDWAQHGLAETFKTANSETMLFPQCETPGCLAHIEEVAAIDGVDGIFVGPFDLSVAMGIPLNFAHPDFKAALQRILAACKAAGKPTIIYAGTIEDARTDLEMGFDSIAYNQDGALLIEALRGAKQAILGE